MAKSGSGTSRAHGKRGYAALSKQPLHILAFLAPLILAYEAGTAVFLSSSDGRVLEQIRAHRLLGDFFAAFGVGGFYLPGVAMAVVLLIWHVLTRDPWRVRPRVLGGMLLESAVWTLPLLVLAQVAARWLMEGGAPLIGGMAAAAPEAGRTLAEMPLGARATIAIGAGLYEELLFRLVGIAAVHFVAADLFGLKGGWADGVAVVVAAAGFAVYHDDPSRWPFFFAAGLLFGGIFIFRGFGIVVAAHAIYDLVALLILSG